ncbi:Protein of unknown function [Pyronema omphalodes CBS 100304]|uniref:Uncharacterized protein n=1 Tax=Pyronema omphalodes (strain CBS 100304) TaxID=1076935 RepID=U4LAL8_PYROM|nr:Protein of unknown function [Pyronema omphalodes CBS 100304]
MQVPGTKLNIREVGSSSSHRICIWLCVQ